MASATAEQIVAQEFTAYKHINSDVMALQLLPNTQKAVISTLLADAAELLFSTLNISYDTNARCYVIVYRYKTETVETTLSMGDYLVRLADGTLVRRDAETFENEYVAVSTEQPGTVGDATADQSVAG